MTAKASLCVTVTNTPMIVTKWDKQILLVM